MTVTAAKAIETRGLSKRFGTRQAVDDIGLDVPAGSVFGFLGPNGSGKTTTIRMLLGLIGPSGGDITVLGQAMPNRADRVLPSVGALIEGPAFYPFLSGTANLLRLDAADPSSPPATRKPRVRAALERVGLTHAASKKVHAYSLGMKQRLGIAHALVAHHTLFILDEPTNGLDPQGTREVRGLVRSLADEGATVFVSSHLLSEIEQMCTHAAIMSAGRLAAQGTLDDLRGSDTRYAVVTTPDSGPAAAVLARLGLRDTDSGGPDGRVVAELPDESIAPETIVAALTEADVRVRAFAVEGESLEDRFVRLTGEGFDVDG